MGLVIRTSFVELMEIYGSDELGVSILLCQRQAFNWPGDCLCSMFRKSCLDPRFGFPFCPRDSSLCPDGPAAGDDSHTRKYLVTLFSPALEFCWAS